MEDLNSFSVIFQDYLGCEKSDLLVGWCRRLLTMGETQNGLQETLTEGLTYLEEGTLRAAYPYQGKWYTCPWTKLLILGLFKSRESLLRPDGSYDKLALRFQKWTFQDFAHAKIRLLPGAYVREGAYIGRDAVVMTGAFVNIGAYIGRSTMIDSGAQVGSCAQIGERVHLSSGCVIGGVLEPIQATPTMIEDDVLVGAGSTITEGVHIGARSIIASGVHLTASTKIIDRETHQVSYGYVPAESLIVPGTYNSPAQEGSQIALGIQCGVRIKRVDATMSSGTRINALLRSPAEQVNESRKSIG